MTTDEFIRNFSPHIKRKAKKMRRLYPLYVEEADIEQEGKIGALIAFETYDEAKTALTLRGYTYMRIHAAMIDYLREFRGRPGSAKSKTVDDARISLNRKVKHGSIREEEIDLLTTNMFRLHTDVEAEIYWNRIIDNIPRLMAKSPIGYMRNQSPETVQKIARMRFLQDMRGRGRKRPATG